MLSFQSDSGAVGYGAAATPSGLNEATPSFYSTATATAEAIPSPGGISKGAVIGAAVGGSLSASLVILAGVLFCLRHRARKTMVIAVESAHTADVSSRCDQLEREVGALREQLDRLEARRLAGEYGYGGEAVLYTHEKDADLTLGMEKKDRKGSLPTYAD
jgi:hypothetical protein